jgi:hypothetical protein
VFREAYQKEGLSPEEIKGKLTVWVGIVSVLQNLGGAPAASE